MHVRPGKTAKRLRRERALARWRSELIVMTDKFPHRVDAVKRQIGNLRKNLGLNS